MGLLDLLCAPLSTAYFLVYHTYFRIRNNFDDAYADLILLNTKLLNNRLNEMNCHYYKI